MDIEEEIYIVKIVRMEVDSKGAEGVLQIKVAGEKTGEGKAAKILMEEPQHVWEAGLADQSREAK